MELAAVSGHQALLGVLRTLISNSYLVVALYQKRANRACARHDHSAIVDRLEARDLAGLQVHMAKHFSHIFNELDLSENKTRRVWIKLCSTDRSQSLAEPSPRVSLVQSGSFSKKTEDICKPDADSHSIFFTYYSYEQQSS